ncbi:Ca2+:H+ antiporter [Chitinophaga ginsengisegetis]|uniref:Ca2+:H+ antiporter n=1 Tax=Chitinophaga ginsengisegetis TaxID=393003 RepID=A0A1T5P9Z8_9BACT|nr:ionic transporter y4hA [Chitinophaga ginsengisegetis]MDR6568969.1 Ca2+:H+ antiporter [Chitinophaga ginsengisegetis]MDR6649002.1 Ca2+:H+ antiporter [Chitinophaga ginsengisegetis]MDR6655050.1 Ca2+:H+ antiporter [Chitinophaga ginsengisegetis]SKD09502.1 Ca2+:H+ antiporter [Chitinophaga ginsengisegetis]
MAFNHFLYRKWKITLPLWCLISPVIGLALLGFAGEQQSGVLSAVMGLALITVVLSAVHHAEVVAHKVGEPYGTLILALAITVIEVSLIVSIMLNEADQGATLARDTVFAAIMLILSGIIGMSLFIGGYRFKEQAYIKAGVSAALVALTAISVLTLVLPNYTTTEAGPVYSSSQLIFVAIISLVLYGGFVAVQTVRHRDYFLPKDAAPGDEDTHAAPPSGLTTTVSLVFLLIALAVVVLLSKKLSPVIETIVVNLGAPKSLVGVIIAAVILLPEGLAAIRAASQNRLQTSLNLALGSALASIGLTIPAVAIVAHTLDFRITLGIDAKSTLLLILSLFTISISFNAGKTNILQGIVLLVILATYLFITVVP